MKRKQLILLITILSIQLQSFAQFWQKKSLIITYSINYQNNKLDTSLLKYLPNQLRVSFCGKKQKSEIFSGFRKNEIISNKEKKTDYLLLSLDTINLAISSYQNQISSDTNKISPFIYNPTIQKNILGYNCQKAIATTATNDTLTAFYTNDIKIFQPNYLTPYSELAKPILEISLVQNGIKTYYKAISIEKIKLPESYFEIPNNFRIINRDEFLKLYSEKK